MPHSYRNTDHRGQLKLAIAAQLPNLPLLSYNDYSLVLVDPPWQFHHRETDPTHRGRTPYPTMADDEILSLPVGAIAAPDAYCLLWTTNSHFPLAFRCLEQWGFSYKQVFTWVKVTQKSSEDDPQVRLGLGHYGRNVTEHFLVGVKGAPGSLLHLSIGRSLPNVLYAPIQAHSQKPEAFYELAEQIRDALGGTAIELFARQARTGFDAWGLEAPREPA